MPKAHKWRQDITLGNWRSLRVSAEGRWPLSGGDATQKGARSWLRLIHSSTPGRIVRRVIVIDREVEVREAVLYDTDSFRDARRKLKAVLA